MFARGVGAAIVAVALMATAARADILYYNRAEHSDIEVLYDAGANQLSLAIGLDDLGLDFEPNQVRTILGNNSISPRPTNPAYNFLGVPAGAPIWTIPQDAEPGRPVLGVGAGEDDESPDGFFQSPLELRIVGVTGPGDFSVWRDAFGGPDVFFTTTGDPAALGYLPVFTTGHQDFSWGFTRGGLYTVDFQVLGRRTDGSEVLSDVFSTQFAVETPEPSSLVVMGTVAVTALGFLRRRGATLRGAS